MAAGKYKELEEYFDSGKSSLTITCVGKVGTGKSALVNGIVGRKLAKEGNSAFTETAEVTLFAGENSNRYLHPGGESALSNEYLCDIYQKTS